MRRYTSILSLPSELIINFLEGLTIQDVVNVAQTCSSFRTIIRSNKQSIMQTRNAFAILDSLPLGFMPAQISSEVLYATAAGSLAISKRLSSGNKLTPRNHILYDLSKLTITWDRQNNIYPSDFFLADHVHLLAFRSSSTLFVIKLGQSDLMDESARIDLIPDRIYRIDYQVSDDGKCLFIAIVLRDEITWSGLLQVYEIPILPRGFGQEVLHLSIGVPYLIRHPAAEMQRPTVTIRHPYVVVTVNHEGLIVINLSEKSGLNIDVLDQSFIPDEDEETMSKAVIDFRIHPQEPVVFIFDEFWRSKFFVFDIPSDMPPLSHSLSSAIDAWPLRKVQHQERPFKFPFTSARWTNPAGFRKLSTSSSIFDIIAIDPFEKREELAFGDIEIHNSAPSPNTRLHQISFHLSDGTRDVESLRSLQEGWKDHISSVVFGTHVLAPNIYMRVDDLNSAHAALVPKFEDGHGHGSCWVQLAIPGYLDLAVLPEDLSQRDNKIVYRGDPYPSLVDVRTGKLYVCRPEGLHVLQY
ncbi:hypothetical protein SISSUDRAFT_1051602 [Sistotremastrum suecicum HHB10207 ss-3]|uniref:F-box domain-containing protein n=1 Tax=Sistotremastrum suecicum HHB10207 ss-3 TaxID=1314776 RepID=A0A166AFK8_9AGAM|nr:hypothetical protein SISSUDRAFT_1051602 [Sistotremastrum suecicum HHB10207 ss-3]